MSEKLKHTPGPWKFNIKKDNGLYQLSGENGSQIGRLWNNKHTDANARLIATAPEMLEILIKQYKWLIATQQIYNPVEMLFVISEVREIIEKATGLKIEEIIN